MKIHNASLKNLYTIKYIEKRIFLEFDKFLSSLSKIEPYWNGRSNNSTDFFASMSFSFTKATKFYFVTRINLKTIDYIWILYPPCSFLIIALNSKSFWELMDIKNILVMKQRTNVWLTCEKFKLYEFWMNFFYYFKFSVQFRENNESFADTVEAIEGTLEISNTDSDM